MNKYEVVRTNPNRLLHIMRSNNAPAWLIDELTSLMSYCMQDSEWMEKASYQELSNGYYVGGVNAEGKRHGTGIYIFKQEEDFMGNIYGDIYFGSWMTGFKHGEGFYFYSDNTTVYYGGWKNGNREGHGCIWSPNYFMQGIYKNDKKI